MLPFLHHHIEELNRPFCLLPCSRGLANAVFDASGVRLRRAPLTPERLKPALA